MTTEQEKFWAGPFGDDYHDRNIGRVQSNKMFFHHIVGDDSRHGLFPESIVEFGAGVGENLLAIHDLLLSARLVAFEINPEAIKQLLFLKGLSRVCPISILDVDENAIGSFDLSMTKGLLVHIAPSDLAKAYSVLYHSSQRWILICEYYNPTPVEVEYRGHAGKLWKRDFAGEMLDTYKDLKLVDYGWRYHRDQYPQDDISWFLLSKGEK